MAIPNNKTEGKDRNEKLTEKQIVLRKIFQVLLVEVFVFSMIHLDLMGSTALVNEEDAVIGHDLFSVSHPEGK